MSFSYFFNSHAGAAAASAIAIGRLTIETEKKRASTTRARRGVFKKWQAAIGKFPIYTYIPMLVYTYR